MRKRSSGKGWIDKMVFTTVGRNRMATLLANDISVGECGTDGTKPVKSDTDLTAGVVATNQTLSTTVASNVITTEYVLGATIGNGNTLREYGVFDASSNMFSRINFTDIAKDANTQVIITMRYTVE